MRLLAGSLRTALLLAVSLACSGCFQLATVIRVRGDGSGTIEQRVLFTQAALDQLKQLAVLGGQDAFDPLSESEARADAERLGPGVTLLSSAPISDATGTGRLSTYAFTDINTIRVAQQPGVARGTVREADTGAQAVTATLTRQSNGNALLTIVTPQPALPSARMSSGGAGTEGRSLSAEQLAMAKQMFAGARMTVAVEPQGTLVRTNSAYVDGPRVTLVDVNVDELLKDPELLPRLQAAKSPEALMTALKGVPGVKINLDRTITIEFTPAK